jgi:uncharacterized membrane protein
LTGIGDGGGAVKLGGRAMTRGRLEAFSDGVLAIIITIMVLELKVPEGHDLSDLMPLAPRFVGYVMSFVYIGIYWNNHHHLLHTVERVSGAILWSNTHLLFWLSLVPATTDWVGESGFASAPVGVYGFVLAMSAMSWMILQRAIIVAHGREASLLARAVGRDIKEYASLGFYLAAIGLAWVLPALAALFYMIVALIWLIPDRRIERSLGIEHGA